MHHITMAYSVCYLLLFDLILYKDRQKLTEGERERERERESGRELRRGGAREKEKILKRESALSDTI